MKIVKKLMALVLVSVLALTMLTGCKDAVITSSEDGFKISYSKQWGTGTPKDQK